MMLTWEFPPRIIGGISTHVYHLSRALVEKGTSVRVITCDFPNAPAEEIIDGVPVSRVDSGRVPESNFLLWIYHLNSQMISKTTELFETERFDLIHAHDWVVGRAAVELKNRLGLPLISTIHATEIGRGGSLDGEYRRKVRDIERLLVEQSDGIICCSNYMLDHIQYVLGAVKTKIRVIPNGVEASRFNNGRQPQLIPTGVSEDRKTILYVGRIVREKGIFTLLDAFEKLRKQGKDVSLVLVGEGPLKEDLAKEVLRRKLNDRVKLAGFVDEKKLVSLYNSSDAFVLPSHYEPFGMVALEAMASRVPVVVSDVGGLSEIVEDGITGVKVPAANPSTLAEGILRVLEDRELSEQLKENAYRAVQERYRWDMIAEKTIEAYRISFAKPSPSSRAVEDAEFLSDPALVQFLLTIGATDGEGAISAGEIASLIKSPETPVKLSLGRQASLGYVSTKLTPDSARVRYHLSPVGIIKACSDMS
ncbi:glycosyltransferase family 4 protein [Candidatus Bathyarchaeota archaeon]|nr:MAG: glycosyltransferase family 4 protein [Candidatus Bathyarchaeota archaeon]